MAGRCRKEGEGVEEEEDEAEEEEEEGIWPPFSD